MSHSCPNLVSTSFLYNPYITFFNLQKFFIYSYNYVEKLSFPELLYILFELYGHMYCYYNVLPEAIFLLPCKQHCLHNFFFRGTYL